MNLLKKMYSISDVLKISGLGRTKLYQEIAGGHLKAKKIGARTVITAEALNEWIDNMPDYLSKK